MNKEGNYPQLPTSRQDDDQAMTIVPVCVLHLSPSASLLQQAS